MKTVQDEGPYGLEETRATEQEAVDRQPGTTLNAKVEALPKAQLLKTLLPKGLLPRAHLPTDKQKADKQKGRQTAGARASA